MDRQVCRNACLRVRRVLSDIDVILCLFVCLHPSKLLRIYILTIPAKLKFCRYFAREINKKDSSHERPPQPWHWSLPYGHTPPSKFVYTVRSWAWIDPASMGHDSQTVPTPWSKPVSIAVLGMTWAMWTENWLHLPMTLDCCHYSSLHRAGNWIPSWSLEIDGVFCARSYVWLIYMIWIGVILALNWMVDYMGRELMGRPAISKNRRLNHCQLL